MPQIFVGSRRKKTESLRRERPGATLVDVTSKGDEPWVRFSPFFPHGGIPVPFWPQETATSVEGVWQGLKVFEREDVDVRKFKITNMSGIKRSTSGKRGRVLGHRKADDDRLLTYRDARGLIYLPTYLWVLQHRLVAELAQLRTLARKADLVLLDYELNEDVEDLSTPLSHAGLIKLWLLDMFPTTAPA